LRTGRFGPFYTSTHDCGETKPFARRVGVQCPVDGGEILEKRSKKGRMFYGCANWPNCDWVSFNRPLQEPCPECGGLQVDMGRGRVRCLKHEGEPPRFASRERANGKADSSTASTNGRAKASSSRALASRNGRTTTRTATSRNGKATASANGKAAPASNGKAAAPANGKAAAPRNGKAAATAPKRPTRTRTAKRA
jgi:DNA topoisomerase-1